MAAFSPAPLGAVEWRLYVGKKIVIAIIGILIVAAIALFVRRLFFAGPVGSDMNQPIDSSRARVELAFDYARQGGMATNQIAAWITDRDGKVVKTLFATDFTAGRGGWKYRKDALAQWVADANVAKMEKAKVDAVSHATPKSGRIRYAWYCDDDAGRLVPPGAYTVNLEGSLRWENRVLYRAGVELYGANAEQKPTPVYSGSGADERGMLANVVVRYAS